MAAAKKPAAKKTRASAKRKTTTTPAATEVPRPRGRPTKKTPDVLGEICRRVSLGETLVSICRDEHMPEWRTVYDWLEADEPFATAYARARDLGFEALAQDLLRIADTPLDGETTKLGVDEHGNEVVIERKRKDMLGHRRLMIETRMRLLAAWAPKKYGSRQTIEHDVADNLADRLKEARERARRG